MRGLARLTKARAWTIAVAAAVTLGGALQISSVVQAHVEPASAAVAQSAVAALAGLVGSKIWFAVLHRQRTGRWRIGGFCVQGFVVGYAATLALLLASAHVSIGTFLDVSTPALFIALATGRLGCAVAGCCAGRVTTSRFGILTWHHGELARRVPSQLIESAATALIGVAAALVLWSAHPGAGVVFVSALAVFAGVRQLLLPLRAGQRREPAARAAILAAAGLALSAAFALPSILGGTEVHAQTAPAVGPISATFMRPVTTYTLQHPVPVPSDVLDPVTYMWTNSNPCGDFQHSNTVIDTWSHPDSEQPGACPPEDVHPGTITVTVTQSKYTCTAEYTMGSAMGVGSPGMPCLVAGTPTPTPTPTATATPAPANANANGNAAASTSGFPAGPVAAGIALLLIAVGVGLVLLRREYPDEGDQRAAVSSCVSCACEECDCDDCDDCDDWRPWHRRPLDIRDPGSGPFIDPVVEPKPEAPAHPDEVM